MKRTFWHNDATPVENTLDRVMYEIKFNDTEGLLLDSVSLADIIEDSDGLMAFDALVTPYARLPARMDVLLRVMIRAGTTVHPLTVQCSEPFMQNGTANVAAIFELSDGQTITIFFHNPDTTPKKILPTDELISWKWLLNKKDITIVVAPEKGLDLNPRQVAVRIMKLAEKNSASFVRSNGKRAERMQALEDLKTEITGLEGDLKGALHRLEIAKVEKEDRDMAVVADPVTNKNKVTLVWSEASEAENKEFSSLNELQQFMREEYGNDVSKVTDIVYDKHKVIINGENSRIVVGITQGDFNPFSDNLSKYLIADGFDVEIESDLPSLEAESADPEIIEPVVEPEPIVEPVDEQINVEDESIPVLSIPEGWHSVTDGKTQEGDYTLEGSGTHNQRYEPIRKAYIGEDASNFFGVVRKIDAYGKNDQSVNIDGLDYTQIDLNADNAKLEWDKAILETDGNEFKAAKNVYKNTLQGHYVNTSIGKVLISGLGWQEIKDGLKNDSLRAKTVPYIAAILKEGSAGAFDTNKKPEKKPDVIGYYPFTKTLEIDKKLVTAVLKVEQKEKGEFVYHLRSSEDSVLDSVALDGTNENASLLRLVPDSLAFQRSEIPTLDSSVEPNTGGVNIFILKVTDLEGNEITELEDSIDTAPELTATEEETNEKAHIWTDAPVNNYVVSRAANNSAKIRPLPGKSFSENDFKLIIDWIKANGWSAHKEKNYVYAIGTALKDKWDDIPDANRTTRHDIKIQEYADKEAQIEAETQETLKHPAAQWIAGVFGDDFQTPWIRASLVRFITGEESETGVMLNHTWLKGLQALGATIEELKSMSRMDILEYIKSKYQETNEQTNEQTEVETETEAAGKEDLELQKNLPKGTIVGGSSEIESLTKQIIDNQIPANEKRAIRYSIVDDAQAEKIKEATGFDVKGYKHTIDSFGIRHAFSHHGDDKKESKHGQAGITANDIAKIPEIVASPDNIEAVGKDANGNDLIRYSKKYDETIYYVEEIREGRMELMAKTLWKTRIDVAMPENSQRLTPEATEGNLPQGIKNIPQPENNAINNEKSLIDAYINSYQASADKINMAIEAIDWSAIVDFKSGDVEEDKFRNTSNRGKDIEIAQNNLRDANIDYDRDLIYESLQFKAHGDAIMAYRAAISKIAELSKSAAIKNGKDKLKNLPENATLEDKVAAVFESKGIKGASADRIINAINNADIDYLRSILGNLSNKSSRTAFEIAAGIKLEKTVKGTLVQIDEWAGITPEQRITINADKQAIRDNDSLLSALKYAWIPLEYIKVNTGKSMQDWIASTYSDGYTNIEKQKKGAATSYYMTNKEHGAIGFKKSKVFNNFLKSALAFGENDETLSMKKALKALNIDIADEELTQLERVNKSYLFNATDDFKEWLAESIDKTEYSPFLTAKTMDEAAKHNGASIEWGFFGGLSKEEEYHLFGKTLDSVSDNDGIDIPIFDEDELGNSYEPDSDDDTVLDSVVMDGIDQTGYVGKILKDGVIAGRIDIGEDGKALVFIGENGDNRVKTKSGIDFMYSDNDAAEMVDLLLNSHQESQEGDDILPEPMSEPEIITPEVVEPTPAITGNTEIDKQEENEPRPNPIFPAVDPVEDLQVVKIAAYSDELDNIKQETNSIELMRRLNDIVARIEADNLMDEMDVKLNQASDAVDELFKEAQKNAV